MSLAKATPRPATRNPLKQEPLGAPRVLLLDIETAPTTASIWSLWQSYTPVDMLEKDWYVLAWCAKWLDEKTIYYEDQSSRRPGKQMEDDRAILSKLWKMLDEADFVIAHNGRKFDVPKLNSRFLLLGMKPPSTYRVIDTLDICKKKFKFTSNKLEFISKVLCPEHKKSKHKNFPGYELWRECLAGNPKAWKEMQAYNRQDVIALQGVYIKLRPYFDTHPNIGLFYEDKEPRCKCCGSTKLRSKGWHYTNVSKYRRFVCNDCGAYSRGGYTEIGLGVRRNMMR